MKQRTSDNVAAARRVRRGSAVLEAALVGQLLFVLSFGCVEFAHFFYVKQTLLGASREGARAAIVDGATTSSVQSAAAAAMTAAGFASSQYTVSIRNAADTATLDPATASAGTSLLVKVESRWGTVGLRPLGILSTERQVVARTVMRAE